MFVVLSFGGLNGEAGSRGDRCSLVNSLVWLSLRKSLPDLGISWGLEEATSLVDFGGGAGRRFAEALDSFFLKRNMADSRRQRGVGKSLYRFSLTDKRNRRQ